MRGVGPYQYYLIGIALHKREAAHLMARNFNPLHNLNCLSSPISYPEIPFNYHFFLSFFPTAPLLATRCAHLLNGKDLILGLTTYHARRDNYLKYN